ncbi:hypothetical protein AHAS_Ahas09G0125000 [Arachis hypogaea]
MIQRLQEGRQRILVVAIDLVGRDIVIERVNIVIDYEMPDSTDTYLHKVIGCNSIRLFFVKNDMN